MAGSGVSYSLKKKILNKAFEGRKEIWRNIQLKTTTGAPDTAARVGTLLWNSFDGDAYICTVASGTWVKINA